MREIVRKLFCVLLVACMVLSVPIAFAEDADQTVEENILNYVIVLDCSESGKNADSKNLCQEACEAFIDSLQEQDCRLALVTMGYQMDPGKVDSDLDQVHVEIPLTLLQAGDRRSYDRYRQQYLQIVAEKLAYGRAHRNSFTPFGQALQVTMDLLEDAKALPENAVIVLITDGDHDPLSGNPKYIDGKDRTPDTERLSRALDRAADKKWPICCVELNYNLSDKNKVAAADKILDQISERNLPRGMFDPALTRISCVDPSEVTVALDRVLAYANGISDPPPPTPIPLPADVPFTVEPLTSEFVIKIVGAGLTRVTLHNDDTGETLSPITGDKSEERLIARVKRDSYTIIKMICPAEGNWTAHMEGQGGVEVRVTSSDFRDMGLRLTATPKRPDADMRQLKKTDEVMVNAVFYYLDIEENNSSFYAQQPATLLVTDAASGTRELPMTGDQSGYHATLDVGAYSSGEITLQVRLEHPMFRGGEKHSNRVGLHTLNEEVQDKAGRPDTVERSAFVNSSFDRVDLNEIFDSPDGDAYVIDLICEDDRSIKFEYSEEALRDGYLEIPVGNAMPGTYHVTIQARDKDMAKDNYRSYSGLILTVLNHAPTAGKLKDVELWLDKYFFQDDEVGPRSIILGDVFQDPDGLPLRYEISGNDDSVLGIELRGDVLTLSPKAEGKVTLKIAAIDSGNEQVEKELKVRSTSGKASFWRHNWIYFVIGLAALVFLGLVIFVVLRNKRVKGQWVITFEENGFAEDTPEIDIAHFTTVGRKGKFLLRKLLDELVGYTNDQQNWAMKVSTYFAGNGAEKLQLVGVVRKQGCKVTNIPASNDVKVSCNGIPASGKSLDVVAGTLLVEIREPMSGNTLSIKMVLK